MATYKNLRKVLNLPTLSASPSSGVNGEMYFNTGDSALYIYDGAWKKVTQTAVPGPPDWTAAAQQAKLVASDAQTGDEFGYSIDISGDTIVAAAYLEDTTASGAGSAYIFTRSGTTWSQQAKIQASDAGAGDNFGKFVAIDGDTMVTGAHYEDTTADDAGAAYVFTRSGTTWSQQAKLQASDAAYRDYLGFSVAIDGDTIVVGAFGEDTGADSAGAAYVFTRSGTTWSQQAKLQASDAQASDQFAREAISISGDTIVVGAYREDTGGSDAGSAYVFIRSGTSWSQQAKLQASDAAAGDRFGAAVSISSDTIVAGASLEDTAGTDTGSVYVFTRSGTSWSQQAKLVAGNPSGLDEFGKSVDIDGDTVIIGATKEDTGIQDTGAAYIFTRSGTTWSEQKLLKGSDVPAYKRFGWAVAIDGSTAVGTTKLIDSNTGAAYTFLAG
tara:strand:+ start:91 stop:1413 length:1323 start_codon:yes stop_codon:yes gene_type:complete